MPAVCGPPASISTKLAARPAYPRSPSKRPENNTPTLVRTRVDRLPAMLLKADLDLKGGSLLDARTILEIFFVQLSSPRTD